MTKFARLMVLVVLLAQLFVPGRSTAMYAPDGAFPSTVGLVSSTVQANPTVSPDSLERPAITYHDQRTGYSYTHADMAIDDVLKASHVVYSRLEGSRYKVYYQRRPYLDYDLHPAPEVLIADHPVADLSSNAFQYPRIATDVESGVHVIWVIKDKLYYRYCNDNDDCTISSSWSPPIPPWLGPIVDCPLYHPSIEVWMDYAGQIRIGISLFVGGSSQKVYVLWKSVGDYTFWSKEVVYSPMESATPSLTADDDQLHVIYRTPWAERSLAYKVVSTYDNTVSDEHVLARDDDPVLAPANLLAPTAKLFVSNYAIKATNDKILISYPNKDNHLIFMTCSALSCLEGVVEATDLTPTLNSTALHDVRIGLTKGDQPILIWKDPSHAIKVARSFDGTWGTIQT